jgi:hypothetical protein
LIITETGNHLHLGIHTPTDFGRPGFVAAFLAGESSRSGEGETARGENQEGHAEVGCRHSPEHGVVADDSIDNADADRSNDGPDSRQEHEMTTGARHVLSAQMIIRFRTVERVLGIRKAAENKHADHRSKPTGRTKGPADSHSRGKERDRKQHAGPRRSIGPTGHRTLHNERAKASKRYEDGCPGRRVSRSCRPNSK